ncbi:hypothetical protein L7F22_045066 [Adiantum nelumboides]|nr:hypothetical protein [Adiantum nelumboides]
MYCQSKAPARLKLDVKDRILVADVGGTIDFVVHEIVKRHPEQGISSVCKVVASYGDTGGGPFVNSPFFELLCQKIGCFAEFCHNTKYSSIVILIYRWWQGIKTHFDGLGYTVEFSLAHSILGEAWKWHDRERGIMRDEDFYNEIFFDDTKTLGVFDLEMEKVLQLIEKEVKDVRVLMMVGGFARSPYLRKRVYHRKARNDDLPELITVNEDGRRSCDRIFSVFVWAGESVDINAATQRIYIPFQHAQRALTFPLYSSPKVYPRYTTKLEVREKGRFEIDIFYNMVLDRQRHEVEVTMAFGDLRINVSAAPQNSGDPQQRHALFTVAQQLRRSPQQLCLPWLLHHHRPHQNGIVVAPASSPTLAIANQASNGDTAPASTTVDASVVAPKASCLTYCARRG